MKEASALEGLRVRRVLQVDQSPLKSWRVQTKVSRGQLGNKQFFLGFSILPVISHPLQHGNLQSSTLCDAGRNIDPIQDRSIGPYEHCPGAFDTAY